MLVVGPEGGRVAGLTQRAVEAFAGQIGGQFAPLLVVVLGLEEHPPFVIEKIAEPEFVAPGVGPEGRLARIVPGEDIAQGGGLHGQKQQPRRFGPVARTRGVESDHVGGRVPVGAVRGGHGIGHFEDVGGHHPARRQCRQPVQFGKGVGAHPVQGVRGNRVDLRALADQNHWLAARGREIAKFEVRLAARPHQPGKGVAQAVGIGTPAREKEQIRAAAVQVLFHFVGHGHGVLAHGPAQRDVDELIRDPVGCPTGEQENAHDGWHQGQKQLAPKSEPAHQTGQVPAHPIRKYGPRGGKRRHRDLPR